jgi:hypothetical protein
MMETIISKYISRYRIKRDYDPTAGTMWNKVGADKLTSHHFPVYERYIQCEQFAYEIRSGAFEYIIRNVTAERNNTRYLDTVGIHICFDAFREPNFDKFNWREYWLSNMRQNDEEKETYFREFPLVIDNRPYYNPSYRPPFSVSVSTTQRTTNNWPSNVNITSAVNNESSTTYSIQHSVTECNTNPATNPSNVNIASATNNDSTTKSSS